MRQIEEPRQTPPTRFSPGLGARIRDAWTKANRALPADHLTSATERLLVEQRAFQKRDLLDDTWIRALLSSEGGPSIPVYLPAKIARRLPLFRRLPARLLAERHADEVPPLARVAVEHRARTRRGIEPMVAQPLAHSPSSTQVGPPVSVMNCRMNGP